jgi:hypothetical protein
MQKSLDTKIARILADPSVGDFILADAKDADMAGGMAAPGKSPEHHATEGKFRTLEEYRELMRQHVRHGLLDIMLMSASSNEVLTIKERLFDNSHMTPAARANDTTDIWMAQGGSYTKLPSRGFATATIDHIMCGKVACAPAERSSGADLGLFSMTFNNHVDNDRDALERYRAFRIEAESKGFRHFLEVFDPNACAPNCPPPELLGRYINDMIARSLAGVVGKGRPVFLKIAYHGPAAMEQLASYDRTLIPGILGGAAGTTFDAFFQLAEAKKYGARAALYGRMINQAENQHVFVQHLRWIADGDITDAGQAVRSYHGSLEKVGLKPYRSLEDDLKHTLRASAYSGTSAVKVAVDGTKAASAKSAAAAPAKSDGIPMTAAGQPDFTKMTVEQKVQWSLKKLRSTLN